MMVLEVPDQQSLLDVSIKLNLQDIPHSLFMEPDINNEATALCTYALPYSLRKKFKKYLLWRLTSKIKAV